VGEPLKTSIATSTSENRLARKSNLALPSTVFFVFRCKLHHSRLRGNIKTHEIRRSYSVLLAAMTGGLASIVQAFVGEGLPSPDLRKREPF
jgi:hypothetical protein